MNGLLGPALDQALQQQLGALSPGTRLLWLTGAGVSAESGIPTFRGPEGYWIVGSKEYHPEELATRAAFSRMPAALWSWYLYRRGICRAAAPNAAHLALAAQATRLGACFTLVTQNVDGLHQRAGLAPERCFAIHGNIDQMRCSAACGVAPQPLPEGLSLDWPRGRRVTEEELARLCCSSCGAPCRPQLLWFDERYDEEHFRIESTLIAATGCQLLIIAGSSGTTNLPLQIAALAHQREIPILVIDPEPGPFTRLAEASEGGHWLRAPASAWVPALCEALG